MAQPVAAAPKRARTGIAGGSVGGPKRSKGAAAAVTTEALGDVGEAREAAASAGVAYNPLDDDDDDYDAE